MAEATKVRLAAGETAARRATAAAERCRNMFVGRQLKSGDSRGRFRGVEVVKLRYDTKSRVTSGK